MSGNTDPLFQAKLADAHQLRRCGLYTNAWGRLEELEPIDRVDPETLALRGSRTLGSGREHSQRADDKTHRITCAEFLHAYARHLVAAGDVEKAKQAVGGAVKLWLPIRVEIVDDDALVSLW